MVGLLGGLLGTHKNRNVAPATPQDDGYVSKATGAVAEDNVFAGGHVIGGGVRVRV
jgi:hypothetical protein